MMIAVPALAFELADALDRLEGSWSLEQEVSPVSRPYISELSKAGFTDVMFNPAVKAKADLLSIFSTDDYPIESIRNAEEGTVAVVIRVGKEGRLADCIVEESSGSPALDSQTCRVLWQRARFEPARDRSGRPTESAIRQRIRWELPVHDPIPLKGWSVRISMEVLKNGGVVACDVQTSGAMKAGSDQCNLFKSIAGGALTQIRADAGYERRKLVIESKFVPGHAHPVAEPPEGFSLVMRQVARLTIDASGQAIKCEIIETEGPQPPVDGCTQLLHVRFEAPGIKVGAVEATMANNLYVNE